MPRKQKRGGQEEPEKTSVEPEPKPATEKPPGEESKPESSSEENPRWWESDSTPGEVL